MAVIPVTPSSPEETIYNDIRNAPDVVEDGSKWEAVTHPNADSLVGSATWNGTTTVTLPAGHTVLNRQHWLKLDSDGQSFRVASVAGNTATIENPDALTIPTGTGATTRTMCRETETTYSSPTMQVGKKAIDRYIHRSPPNADDFSARTGHDRFIDDGL